MIENELKYVLRLDCRSDIEKECGDSTSISQGYLPGRGRIRAKRGRKKDEFFFTYKIPVEGKVFEIEKNISQHEFEALWPLAEITLAKERYTTMIGDIQWDIDFFHGEEGTDFVLAEAEMPEDMPEPSKIPKFLRKNIIYAVPRIDTDAFSSRKLANDTYRRELAEEFARLMSSVPS